MRITKKHGLMYGFMNYLLIILSLSIIIFSNEVNAGVFDVGLTVVSPPCIPEWYCTAYSQTTCGVRECVDIIGCGVDTNKPVEVKNCGGGSANSNPDYVINYPPNESEPIISYPRFRLSTDIIRTDIPNDFYVSKSVNVYADIAEDYQISIQSSNEDFTKLVSLSKTSIIGNDTFNININSTGIAAGVYNGLITVGNSKHSKHITMIINILSEGPEFEIIMDRKNIILDNSTILIPVVKLKNPLDIVNITYILVSNMGNELFKLFSSDTHGSAINMPMPAELTKGYYTFAVEVSKGENKRTKFMTFYADPDKTLIPYVEQTKTIVDSYNIPLIVISGTIIILLLLLLLLNNHHVIKKKVFIKNSGVENLRKAYERGFITKKKLDKYLGNINTTIADTKDIKNELIKKSKDEQL